MNTYYILMYCIGCYAMAAILGHATWNTFVKRFTNHQDPNVKIYANAMVKVFKEHPSMINIRKNPVTILLFCSIMAINIPFILPIFIIVYPVYFIRKLVKGERTPEEIQQQMQKSSEFLHTMFSAPAQNLDLKQMGLSDQALEIIKQANAGVHEKCKTWKGQQDVIDHYQPFHERIKNEIPDFSQFCSVCHIDLQQQTPEQNAENPFMSEPVKERDYSGPDTDEDKDAIGEIPKE